MERTDTIPHAHHGHSPMKSTSSINPAERTARADVALVSACSNGKVFTWRSTQSVDCGDVRVHGFRGLVRERTRMPTLNWLTRVSVSRHATRAERRHAPERHPRGRFPTPCRTECLCVGKTRPPAQRCQGKRPRLLVPTPLPQLTHAAGDLQAPPDTSQGRSRSDPSSP